MTPAPEIPEAPRHTGAVTVSVFGPVTVDGAARPFTRAFALDLVTYLVLHPHGAGTDQWVTALWPDRVMAPATIHSTSSAARRALGTSTDGRALLPQGHARLRMSDAVGCDVDLVTELLNADRLTRRAAMAVLRGRPFDGLRRYEWVISEGHLARAESVASRLTASVASDFLSDGDAVGAQTALRRGLAVTPYDEGLWRLLLDATYATGSASGLDQVIAELAVVLGASPVLQRLSPALDLADLVHPATWDHYVDLRKRGRS